jgi:hypothetical protein
VAFSVDGNLVRVVDQSPSYPMQFMLTLYEFAEGPTPASARGNYPKRFVVDSFRGYRPVSGRASRGAAFGEDAG